MVTLGCNVLKKHMVPEREKPEARAGPRRPFSEVREQLSGAAV